MFPILKHSFLEPNREMEIKLYIPDLGKITGEWSDPCTSCSVSREGVPVLDRRLDGSQSQSGLVEEANNPQFSYESNLDFIAVSLY
jgi:hypothetical protein